MAIRREWLDWNQPCLPAAAAWLIQQVNKSTSQQVNNGVRASHRECDLSGVLCVVPGRRAGRLLLGELIQHCKQAGLQLTPPAVLTPDPMVDRLLGVNAAVANSAEIELAWINALQQADSVTLAPLLPARPGADDLSAWRELASILARLHDELCGQRLKFADVAARADRFAMVAEGDRWRAMDAVRNRYAAVLQQARLVDPQAAREAALSALNRIPLDIERLVLIGVTELNAMQRSAIATVIDRTTALVHAPMELADRFDEFGCVIPHQWSDVEIALDDDQIRIADQPADQAQHALRAISELDAQFAAAQITIGLGDESIASALERAAEWAGLSVRSATGGELRQSPPFRALEVITNWLEHERFANFAAMVRHPDIEGWLWSQRAGDEGVSDWLTLLDRYFADHLHERFSGEWLGDEKRAHGLASIHDAIARLLAPLRPKRSHDAAQPLSQWAQPILDVLSNLYGDLDAGVGDPARRSTTEACLALRDALADFAAAPPTLQPPTSAAAAIRMLLEHIAGARLTPEMRDDQIEMLGWLELHLDLAPVLIVTGFNEGNIPQSVTADAFLPDSLRRELGLNCNLNRYARDAYLLEAIRHSRPHVTIVAGRRTAQGEPLTPSRLLLACDQETLVQRVAALSIDQADLPHHTPIGLESVAAAESKFIVPALPRPLPPPQYMTITEFKNYLACPYRYALQRRLNLEGCDDSALELDPLQFGTLAHQVLCAFGSDSDINCSAAAEKIEKFLLHALDAEVRTLFGKSPPPAVQIQAARLCQRLRSFAHLQARLCEEGWRILHCELNFDRTIALDVPGQEPMPLRGRIDRIDFNERTGTWRVLDYKTGDRADSPHKTHHNRETLSNNGDLDWRDLQLPLYRYLVERCEHNIKLPIELAYICLPRQANGASVKPAEWSASHIDHALDRARQVVRDIRAERFAINNDFDDRFDDFARICQTRVYGELEPEPELEEIES